MLPENATDKSYIVSSSSNINVIELGVNRFKLTANSIGAGWIKFIANDSNSFSNTIPIIVKPYLVNKLETIPYPDSKLELDNTLDFEVKVTPENATDKSYTLTGTNFTYTDNGNNNWTAKPISIGQASIELTSNDGNYSTSIENIEIIGIQVKNFEVSEISNQVTIGTEFSYTVTALPENATDKTYTIEHSTNLININEGSSNIWKCTPNALGSAWIKIISNDESNFTKTVNFDVIGKKVTSIFSRIT